MSRPSAETDAGRYGAAEPKRIANCHDPVTDARYLTIKLHIGEVGFSVDLDKSEVSLWVGSDDFRSVG